MEHVLTHSHIVAGVAGGSFFEEPGCSVMFKEDGMGPEGGLGGE